MSGSDESGKKLQQEIEAIDFRAPPSAAAQTAGVTAKAESGQRPFSTTSLVIKDDAPWWHSQFNLMLAVFGMLVLAAVVLILLAPEPDASGLISGKDSASAEQAISAQAEAPWDENRRAQARTDSQAILSNLLDSKKSLENKNVQEWAGEKFQAALATAAQGDEFYKQQNYRQAIGLYQSAVDGLDRLHKSIPALVQRKIKEGNQALSDGKSQLARASFAFALKLEPGNISASDALSRADKLDRVLALLQAVEKHLQQFQEQDDLQDLTSAQVKITEALEIDPLYERSTDTASQIAELMTDKQYRVAMSDGYAALFSSRYSAARSAFSSALKIKPDDPTASAAHQQSLASNKSSSLQSLLDKARRFEQNEEWQNALSNYQAVLQRDPNQVAAKLGEIRSRARSQLDSQIRLVLADPLALGKTSGKSKANAALDEALAISRKGPKLKQQIAILERMLQSSDVAIKVQFLSDELTEVTLRKAGAQKIPLGRFSSKNLALKPGRYVVSGARAGFRDVRKEIDLFPGADSVQLVNIRCTDPVTLALEEDNNEQV